MITKFEDQVISKHNKSLRLKKRLEMKSQQML